MNPEEFFKKLGIESTFSPPISSGFQYLDELIQGGFSNEIVTLASRPGHGKTAFLFNLMMNFSQMQNFKGIVAFPRMSQRQFVMHFTSWMTNTDVFKNGFSEEAFKKIYEHYINMTSKKVQVIHRVISLEEIFTIAQINKVDYIILDDYFRSYAWQYDLKRYFEDFSKIQSFIEYTNISVFVSILTSRMPEKRGGDRRPILSDIFRSDLVSTYSNKIIQLYRPEQYGITIGEDGFTTIGLVELLIQQNSSGRTGALSFFHFAPFRMREDPVGRLRIEMEKNPSRPGFFDDLYD
ncbi:DnaB-like helicase C-terminal domain-containing protein [Algoriphagus limi]|uniref:SF4 helicase domain-containing protein n=1 Tax=Algoriphagus limi TaxID=2975273 RepID=A0ABT2G0R8_9BACT|nr:DnaB-like helicase C-terminal domain-containing protein [Algoriphagus limi]MCS5488865.1 hypothetical protein [Algoriphagus limi]